MVQKSGLSRQVVSYHRSTYTLKHYKVTEKGLSKQVVSLDTGLSNQVALYCTIPESWLHVEVGMW